MKKGKYEISKLIFVVSLIFVVFSPLFNPFFENYTDAKMWESKWGDVPNKTDALVFKFEFISVTPRDYLSYDEYILDDEIYEIQFTILNHPSQMIFDYFVFNLTSPSGKSFQFYKYGIDSPFGIKKILIDPIKLNESGIWFLTIQFQFYVGTSNWSEFTCPILWEYIGDILEFNEESRVRGMLEPIYGCYFKKGISVYTHLESAQIRAAKAAEDTANKYETSLRILAITAGIAFAAALVSAYNTKISKKYMEQSIEEQKKSQIFLFKPKIYAKFNFFSPELGNIKITNVGKGVALKVHVTCETEPPSEKITFSTKFMEPNEHQEINLKYVDANKIFHTYKEIKIKADYEDIFKQKQQQMIKIDLKDIEQLYKTKKIGFDTNYIQKIYNELKNWKNNRS